MSGLDDDLAALEASDPEVAQAAQNLDQTTADILARAGSVNPESTSVRLRHAEQEMDVVRGSLTDLAALYDSATAETARVAAERDQLAVAVAGWVARFHAAYDALYIEEFDGDSCPDLEATIAYAVSAYRRVCESEEAAAEQISQLRAERDKAANTVGWLQAQNTVLLEHRDLLRAELASASTELALARCELESWRGHSGTQRTEIARLETLLCMRAAELERLRTTTPTSKEKSTDG